jgi:hypothetical protein
VPQWVDVNGGWQRRMVWMSFSGRRRPNRVRLRLAGWLVFGLQGGQRRCLMVGGR